MSWLSKLLKKEPPKVIFPGSVELTWGNHFWEGSIKLPVWAGFGKRLGEYHSVTPEEALTGDAKLSVSPAADDPAPPSSAQSEAFSFVLTNGAALQERILKAIFDFYPKWRKTYEEFLADRLDEDMPLLAAPLELKPLIALSTVHILAVEKDGRAYSGFDFACTWDEEHGLGVMLHKDRVVEVGSSEDAFDIRVAKKDAEKSPS